MAGYVPERGEIVWLSFSPQADAGALTDELQRAHEARRAEPAGETPPEALAEMLAKAIALLR